MKNIHYLYFSILIALLFSLSSCNIASIDQEVGETIYVRHKGADIPAYVHGKLSSKTFLVVTHGAGSFGLAFRDGQFTRRLEREYVVVYFDQRGQGMSQGHYSKPDDLIDLMASDLEALTDVLKHKYGDDIDLFLMGHSWGGLLTSTALLREDYQETFKGWINVAGLLDLPSASEYRREMIMVISDELQAAGNTSQDEWVDIRTEAQDLDPEADYDKILALAGRVVKLLVKDEVVDSFTNTEKLYRAIVDNNPITWQVSHLFNKPVEFAKDVDYSVLNRLNDIQIPTLFIYGKYDVSVPYTSGVDAFQEVGAREKNYILYNRSMHHPHDSDPLRFANDVSEFIKRHK